MVNKRVLNKVFGCSLRHWTGPIFSHYTLEWLYWLLKGFKHYHEVKWSQVTKSCLTLCDPMDYSLLCSSVHGIFQARILEWIAISFSRESSWPKDRTQVSHTVGRCFTVWATGEVQTLSYDLAIPFLGIHLKVLKELIWKDICTPVFIQALFIVAIDGISQSVHQQMNEYTYTRALFSI